MKKKIGLGGCILIAICVLFVSVFLILPLVFVLVQAFRNGAAAYLQDITDTYTVKAFWLTIAATLSAVTINAFFGLFAAWAVTRYTFRGKKLLMTLIDLPLSVSPVIAGLIFLLVFGSASPIYGFLQSNGIKIAFAIPGIIIVTTFVTFPYISREIIPVLESKGREEEEAAALMGAGGFTIFRRITFPHIKWSFLYGLVLCSARAMGEFGAVSIISGHLRGKTNTLPLHIEILYNEFKYAPAFAVSSILVFLTVILLIVRSAIEYKGKKKEDH
jgi:sulfate ABC transporter, permease protein